MTSQSEPQSQRAYGWLIFGLVAIAGLFYVKWFPYCHRAFTAETTHSIGKSILMGRAATPPAPSFTAALDYAWAYGKAIWQAMVLGLLLGSAVQALVPIRWVARVLGRHGFGSVAAGGVLALPSMMCTCCAAPVVVGLRARNASAGGAMAFWLSNSVLNPATLVFMGFVLGWKWSALRLVLGVLMVLGLGWLSNRLATPRDAPAADDSLLPQQRVEAGNVFMRWSRIFARMTVRLLPEYIVLVLLLGAARAWLFPHIGPEVTSAIGWVVAFAVAGMLFVIPTAGEVPIIQAMLTLGMGMGVGPAGALLMTLPPVSVPSFAMLAGPFRPRVLVVVGTVVVLFGVIAGIATVGLGF